MGGECKTYHLIFIFVCFSFLLSTLDVVPSSRNLMNPNKHDQSAPIVLAQGKKFELKEEAIQEERKVEQRTEIELTDYPGTGANNNHDPRSPGN